MVPVAQLTRRRGDATQPSASGPHIIAHGCNNRGKWGRGFVVSLAKRYPSARTAYLDWYAGRGDNDFGQGAVQIVAVAPDTWVANLITQEGLYPRKGVPPVRYDAIEAAFTRLADFALDKGAAVHMPRIGAGLAGGDWPRIEALVQTTLVDRGVPVTIYTLS